MPRIDPLQLLKCLSVLLTPEGGILSRDEVPRLVNLMTKFSKKLVSKCVYVLILKNTETELVDMFMAEGGWTLIQTWLQDAVQTSNWDLVREILGLLLITPVDVERLKLNILPKLIKSLSRREELEGVARLSTQLVQQWLAIVKGSSNIVPQQVQILPPMVKVEVGQTKLVPQIPTELIKTESIKEEKPDTEALSEDNKSEAINAGTFYKPSVRDGKLVIRKLASVEDGPEASVVTASADDVKSEPETKEKLKEDEKSTEEKEKDRDKRRSSSSKSSKSSSRSSSSSKDKDRDKDRKKSSSSSSKSSSSSSSKSKNGSSSSRDKDRKDKDKDRDKDRHRNNGLSKTSSSKSSSSSKDRRDSKEKDRDKDKQAEKDKDTLAKIKPQTIEKLGRIPKKPGNTSPVDDKAKESKDNKEVKKKTFSVGIRKDSEERPKTVKVFNSKMRSTGLEEEVKPAPPRPVKKPTPSVQLPTIPPKRPSPPREPVLPPEKKLKIDIPERPGAIKLIPPKPKPMLQESDLFMDALAASATAKKEPKKRKRRLSVTKESPSSPSSSPARDQAQPTTPTSPPNSNAAGTSSPSLGLKNIAPINFYQDTLSTEENGPESAENDNKENAADNVTENETERTNEDDKETPVSPATPTDDNNEEPSSPKRVKLDGGMRGVLLYAKKKGPKKTISWKTESDLVEIRYFELDETERVNVTKTFGDMAKMEMTSEREALMSRKIGGEDTMEAQIMWKLPYLIEQPDPLAVPGHKSLEKDIQFAREKSVLQALYFDKRRIPDSPEEPIPENHQMSDPVLIPLEDPESQEIDLKSTPWPEPKGSPPHVEPQLPPHIFPNIPGSFNTPFNNMPPPQFQSMPPRFGGQPVPGGPGPLVPGNFIPPNLMPNGNMMGPPNMGPPNEMMNQGPMNPNMFPPGPVPDAFVPAPEFPMFANQNPPNNMNMFPPNNFNNHRQGNRGFRRGGGGNGGNWVRMNGPNNWKRGGGHRGGRLCKNIQNHGYCRNGDNCPFVHP